MKTRRPVSIYTPLSVRPRPPPPSTTRLLLSSRAGHPARGGDLDSWRPPSRAGSRAAADPPASSSLLFPRTCRVSGLEKSSSAAAIKKAYRQLALRWHPDKNPGDADANAKFQEIGRAYAVLSDAKKRKYYDETGDAEDVDVSAEDFIAVFQDMMRDMLGGASIADVLEGLDEDDLARMPPFPFPEALFPPGTFPPGMRFAEDFHMPPAVEELLERGGPDALAAMFGAGVDDGDPTNGNPSTRTTAIASKTKPKLGADADAEGELEDAREGSTRRLIEAAARVLAWGPGPGPDLDSPGSPVFPEDGGSTSARTIWTTPSSRR